MTWLHAHRRLAIFAVIVLAQALLVIAIVVREEGRLDGVEIVLESRPVDPRDPLRGDYVILGYVAEDLSAVPAPGVGNGDTVYVELSDRGQYWEPGFVYTYLIPRDEWRDGQVFVRARVEQLDPLRVSYPNIGEYFIPQGAGNPPEPPDVVASVSDDGAIRIKRLEIDGRVWPDEFDPSEPTPVQPRPLATGTPLATTTAE
jgi:uncharacterized membrane-anchored protein